MNWLREVRLELLAYNALRANHDEILRRLGERDEDIRPSNSRLDGMPRAQGGLPRSSVEDAVLRREEELVELRHELQRLNRRIDPIQRALSTLSWLEHRVIHLTYHSMTEASESVKSLGLSLKQFEHIKHQALWKIFDSLIAIGKGEQRTEITQDTAL